MARIIVGAVAVCAIALFPATSHAGKFSNATIVAISADPDQLNGEGGAPDCSTLSQCTFTRPNDGSLTSAIQFVMVGPATTPISAGLWVLDTNLDCSGDPDAVISGSLHLPDGPNIVYIIFTPSLMAGDTFSMEWLLGACPLTSCVNYVIGSGMPAACM